MSGRKFERGRGRGRGRGDRGVPYRDGGKGRGGFLASFDSQDARGGRSGRGGDGRGGFAQGRGGPVEAEIFSPGYPPQPDPRVQKIEDETVRAGQVKKTSSPEKAIIEPRLPERPGYGTRGKKVVLWANYFELVAHDNLLLFRYDIEILPYNSARSPTGKRAKRIVELLLKEHLSTHQHSIATDFNSTLIYEPTPHAKTYRLRLQATGTLRVSELMDHLTSTNASSLFGSKDEIIQALNIVIGQHPKAASNIFSIGANKHFELDPARSETRSLGAGLQAVRGFFVSVRGATARMLVNIHVKHAACYNEGPLGQLMHAYLHENDQDMVKLGYFLKHVPGAGDSHRLATPGDGHGLPQSPIVPKPAAGAKEVKFFVGSPTEETKGEEAGSGGKGGKKGKMPAKSEPQPAQEDYISVYDFFQRTYGITIKDPSLPVLNVGNRQNPSYLPPDVCVVLPGQRADDAKLSPSQTQQMIRFAVRKPAQNAQSLVTNGARLLDIHSPTNTTLDDLDIAVTPKLIAVPGRVLTGPDVKYKGGKVASTRFGSWNMQAIQFSNGSTLPSWTYLWISSNRGRDAWRSEQDLSSTLNAFRSKLKEVGIDAAPCTPGLRITVTEDNVDLDIQAAIHRFVSHVTRPAPKLLLVIVPSADPSIYKRVKFECDVKKGVRNVCVVGSKFAKDRNDQYFANVALKCNLKLGGRNQLLDNSALGIIAEGKTMVVGIDVTHPSPGSSSAAPSVAGIVASIDQWLAQWPADLQIQTARQEMVSGLDCMFKSRLRLWAKHNKAYPENILIYRDGVSEGQYNIVLDKELPLIRQACNELYPASDTNKGLPRLSLIIVGKRHNTRFFSTRKEDADRSSNPQNGTVVDRGVTEARNWDCFLQAHSVIQGTARPAHYFVVLDEIFRGRKVQARFENAADALEDLIHNMCYLYGRATKAVSICPAAYYADLVCERARCYLSRLFDATPGATPAGSVTEGGGGKASQAADPNDVRIHENVRDTMFYI